MCCTDVAAILFNFFFNRRSREINEGEVNDDAAAHNETARGSSSTHTSTEGPSSGDDYEVFLNFRGPDTREGFTNFLYTILDSAGIRTFEDREELDNGEEFPLAIRQAINQSKISIPIFSKGYASSEWCLNELVQMVECWKNGRQKIMPIFYDVTPSEVRHQTWGYGLAFCLHKMKRQYGKETISRWKAALHEVSFLSGRPLHDKKDRREGQLVKTITQEVFKELNKAYLKVSDELINVDHQVNEIMERINTPTSDTRTIVLHGMGGIGKITIAKIIFNELSPDFKYYCFLSNIREMSKKGIVPLQNQLISTIGKNKETNINDIGDGIQKINRTLSKKRVLLLLDDVEEEDHISALVGSRCFGMGSKLIITTRKQNVLHDVDCSYEVYGMDDRQSLQLFSKHAFRRDSPLDKYIDQSKRAIRIADGLPLALEVIGSLLSHTKKEMWDAQLTKLESVLHEKVENTLKISYDALDNQQQQIFLDIACLFIGYDKDILVHFWDASQLHPEVDMEELQNRSLIKIIKDNEVWMHDQLRDLGRKIVRKESNWEIKKQSRVWDPEEALKLRRHEGEKEVKALRLKFDHEMQYRFTCKELKSLSNLMFLEVDSGEFNSWAEESLLWHKSPSIVLPTNGSQDNSVLLPHLLWFSWHHIPTTFEITNFSMKMVVILDLSRSKVTHDWKGWDHMKVMNKLKILNLSYCECLERNPNFPTNLKLERLILSCCRLLIEIDRSICQLKQLVSLDLRWCWELQRLPEELGRHLTRLEYLSLNGCKLERLPNSIGKLKSLIEFDISSIPIRELPDSIINLKKLKVVKMWFSVVSKIPEVLWTIEKLEEIEFHCRATPIIHVKIGDCIYRNQSLRILKLLYVEINALPMLPKSLINLELSCLYMDMDMFPNLSYLTNLKVLNLWFGPDNYEGISSGPMEVFMPRWIGNLSNLESLDLGSPYVTTSPIDLTLPSCLKSLEFMCPNLHHLPKLPSSLSSLRLRHCNSLCSVEDLSNLKKLSYLEINNAAIIDIQGLGCLENLQSLWLFGLQHVKMLSDLSNFNKLRRLQVECCANLIEIEGKLPESLVVLHICGCESLLELPDLANLNGLQEVRIDYCKKLDVEAIYRRCSKKSVMFRRSSSDGEDDE